MAEEQKRRGRDELSAATTQQNDATTIDLVELMYRLLGSWKLLVGVALAFAIVAGIYTSLFVTPKYQATSTIYVLSRRDENLNMSDLQIGTALTSDYIKVFDMWEVNEAVIANLNLPYSCNALKSMRSISNDTGTRMLDITITSTSPDEAAIIANEYAEVGSQYIADNMATDKPSIMSVALIPTSPVSPNKKRSVMLGFILGFLLAAGIVTVRMLVDDTYKTAEDIHKYTGLATLAVIPVEDLDHEYRRGRSGRRRGKYE